MLGNENLLTIRGNQQIEVVGVDKPTLHTLIIVEYDSELASLFQ